MTWFPQNIWIHQVWTESCIWTMTGSTKNVWHKPTCEPWLGLITWGYIWTVTWTHQVCNISLHMNQNLDPPSLGNQNIWTKTWTHQVCIAETCVWTKTWTHQVCISIILEAHPPLGCNLDPGFVAKLAGCKQVPAETVDEWWLKLFCSMFNKNMILHFDFLFLFRSTVHDACRNLFQHVCLVCTLVYGIHDFWHNNMSLNHALTASKLKSIRIEGSSITALRRCNNL